MYKHEIPVQIICAPLAPFLGDDDLDVAFVICNLLNLDQTFLSKPINKLFGALSCYLLNR